MGTHSRGARYRRASSAPDSFFAHESHHSRRMNYDLSQVYAPEADSVLLLEAARSEVRPDDLVLEVGTGSGLIAAELSRIATVVATDISPHAVFCARDAGADVVRTDLFAGMRGPFDLIVFNPPYLPTRPEERLDDWLEHALDGGKDGRAVIGRFAAGVGSVLAPGGRILLLVSSLTGIGEVQRLFADKGFLAIVVRQQEIEGEVLYVLKMTRKDS